MKAIICSHNKNLLFEGGELNNHLQLRNKEAISHLYDTYAPALLSLIKRKVNCLNAAEKILETVFKKTILSISTHSPGKGSLFTWMSLIARNEAFSFLNNQAAKTSDLKSTLNEDKNASPIYLKAEFFRFGELRYAASSQSLQSVIIELYNRGFTSGEIDQLLSIRESDRKSKM